MYLSYISTKRMDSWYVYPIFFSRTVSVLSKTIRQHLPLWQLQQLIFLKERSFLIGYLRWRIHIGQEQRSCCMFDCSMIYKAFSLWLGIFCPENDCNPNVQAGFVYLFVMKDTAKFDNTEELLFCCDWLIRKHKTCSLYI